LGGKKPANLVANTLHHIMVDIVASKFSLKGAQRKGVAKKSFAALGILPFIKSKCLVSQKNILPFVCVLISVTYMYIFVKFLSSVDYGPKTAVAPKSEVL